MKASNYNLFVPYSQDNVIIGFNSVSGGILIFSGAQYKIAQNIFKNPDKCLSDKETELKNMLIDCRFLINDNVDEVKLLKVRNNLARHNILGLGLIISPTLLCNFDCPYCYVDREKIKMGVETIEKIKKFVLKKLEYISKFQVCWTGGEPLLAIEVIEELNSFFIKETNVKKKKFSSSMVTNGYLLDLEYINRLNNCGISSIQITIDGYKEYHDKFRYTKGKGKTYEKILENVVLASKKNIEIILRSNLSADNIDGIYKLIDDLAARDLNKKKLKFTPCKVVGKIDKNVLCNLFSTKDFAKIEPKIIEYALKAGIPTNIIDMGTIQTFCGANRISTYVIDPYANLLKCWCNLGDITNNKIGWIKNNGEEEIDFPALSEWIGWDPLDLDDCKKCRVLPLCLGGCKYYNESELSKCTEDGCTHRKYNIEEMLKLYHLNLTKYNHQGKKNE